MAFQRVWIQNLTNGQLTIPVFRGQGLNKQGKQVIALAPAGDFNGNDWIDTSKLGINPNDIAMNTNIQAAVAAGQIAVSQESGDDLPAGGDTGGTFNTTPGTAPTATVYNVKLGGTGNIRFPAGIGQGANQDNQDLVAIGVDNKGVPATALAANQSAKVLLFAILSNTGGVTYKAVWGDKVTNPTVPQPPSMSQAMKALKTAFGNTAALRNASSDSVVRIATIQVTRDATTGVTITRV
jgi:hypothetical protein